MLKIWLHKDVSDREGGAAYEAYLSRRLPPPFLAWQVEGQNLFIFRAEMTKRSDSFPKGQAAERKFLLTKQAYMEWKRLPVGMAVTVSAEGLQVCEAADISPDLADYREAKEECPLDGVCTLQEACGLYGMSEQQVEDICGRGMEENSAGGHIRRSGTSVLVRKSLLDKASGRTEKIFLVNPLLFVFSSIEAAELWNRPSGDVRSAAAGSGHRAARMQAYECRHAGKVWLVTRGAMERIYGGFDGEKMARMTASLFAEKPFSSRK